MAVFFWHPSCQYKGIAHDEHRKSPHEEKTVLRISRIKENQSRITLKVEGRLVSDWVHLLERECAEISVLGYPLSLDLGDVSFVDGMGEQLLQRLFKTYRVSRCSSFILQLLQQPERES